jgi:cyclic beta-1,2-glucan synthetase
VGIEGILGLSKCGDRLVIEPRAPATWKEYGIEYRHGQSLYSISVRNDTGAPWRTTEVTVDGIAAPGASIPLVDDGKRHEVIVRAVAG